MNRVILAPNDDLTPFDLRAQIFRVNAEFSARYRGQKKISKISTFSIKFRISDEINTVFFFTQFNSKRIATDK